MGKWKTTMPVYAVITAAGKGLRMGGDLPKQFLSVDGRSILSRTIDCFAPYADEIVVTLNKEALALWESIVSEESGAVPTHRIVIGGETRFQSIKNALQTIPDEALVAIHDGVRPYVAPVTIENCLLAAQSANAAIPVQPIVESLRLLEPDGKSRAVDRSCYVSVQTPQCFWADRIKKAYCCPYRSDFTDDASVYEALYGVGSVVVVEGNWQNIKITRPGDLLFRPWVKDR